MSTAVVGMGGTFPGEERRLPRFLVSSLVAHGVGLVLLFGLGLHFSVPSERPLKVRLVDPPAPAPAVAAPAVPAAPSALPGPGRETARPEAPPELVEAPKPKVEQAPRSKRFAGLYDRPGGPAAKGAAPDSETVSKTPARPPAPPLRGEEAVRLPALPPAEAGPGASPPAAGQETKVAKAEPLPSGRTSVIQSAPSAAPQAPPAAVPRDGPAPGGRVAAPQVRLPARPFRDQIAGLPLGYRAPVDDPGTAGDATGRGEPGLETFRFKYATWGLAVKKDIERAWKVPPYGISSLAVVTFLVLPDGKVQDLQLEHSSGLTGLDQAAMSAISDAAPFRPFPPRMREELPRGLPISVNFYYREGRGILQWD